MVLPPLASVHRSPAASTKVQRLKRGKTLASPTLREFSCRVEDLLG
jgi:hypothetical protein